VQRAEARCALDEVIAQMRAERRAVRDFTAYVEAELAAGKSQGEIADPVRAVSLQNKIVQHKHEATYSNRR
jgi:hypothetical protein